MISPLLVYIQYIRYPARLASLFPSVTLLAEINNFCETQRGSSLISGGKQCKKLKKNKFLALLATCNFSSATMMNFAQTLIILQIREYVS